MGKGRAPCCDKTKVKRGPWSPAEDLRLIAFIQKNGHDNWRSLPKLAGLARCGKSCRLRWINYLRPDVKRGNFTEEEEETIIRLHESMGNKWSKIAAYLPGRTDNEIKNVWNTHLKKKVEHTKKGEGESSRDVSTITSSSSPTPSSSSSSCNKSKRKMEQVLVEEHKHSSCEQNKRIMTESLKGTTTNEDNNLKEVSSSSSSSMSHDSNVAVTKPKSCEDGHMVHNKKSSSEEVNKPAAAAAEDSDCFNNFLRDIPNLEADFDLWSMVDDMDNLGPYFQSINDVVVQDKVADNKNSSYLEDEQKKWLKHMESELGLEETKEPDDLLMINPAEDDFLGNLVYSQIWS